MSIQIVGKLQHYVEDSDMVRESCCCWVHLSEQISSEQWKSLHELCEWSFRPLHSSTKAWSAQQLPSTNSFCRVFSYQQALMHWCVTPWLMFTFIRLGGGSMLWGKWLFAVYAWCTSDVREKKLPVQELWYPSASCKFKQILATLLLDRRQCEAIAPRTSLAHVYQLSYISSKRCCSPRGIC